MHHPPLFLYNKQNDEVPEEHRAKICGGVHHQIYLKVFL